MGHDPKCLLKGRQDSFLCIVQHLLDSEAGRENLIRCLASDNYLQQTCELGARLKISCGFKMFTFVAVIDEDVKYRCFFLSAPWCLYEEDLMT